MCRHHYYGYGGDRFFEHNNYGGSSTPPANITESPGHFTLKLYAPGIEKDVIDVGVTGDLLVISADGSINPADGQAFRYQEFTGKFRRSFRLNGKVDIEHITASYEQGILVVDLPKISSVNARNVSVN